MERISNEEKARVLSNKGCLGAYISKDAEALNPTEETKKRLSIYGACLEAMQWKDEQFAKEKQTLIQKYEDKLNKLNQREEVIRDNVRRANSRYGFEGLF